MVNQRRKTAQAAQQVEKRIGFYVHLTVFILVCAGLAAVNIFGTPEVWWAQWAFIGWGVAVVFHGLCAYGRGPDAVAAWRLRKIHQLAAADPVSRSMSTSRGGIVGLLLVGILIGCLVGAAAMYLPLQAVREETQKAQRASTASATTAKELDAELQQASKARSDLEATVKETKSQLDQTQAAKRVTEQRLQELTDQLTQAVAAREAAERALAEAKK